MKKILMILTLLFAGIAASGQQYTGRKVTAIDSVVTDTIRARTQAGVWIQGLQQTDPAGNNTEIQFNDNGAFGASSDLTWNGTGLSIDGLFIDGTTIEDTSATGGFNLRSNGGLTLDFDYSGGGEVGDVFRVRDAGVTILDFTNLNNYWDFEGNDVKGIGSLTVDNLTLDGNTMSSSTGTIDLVPTGTQDVRITNGGDLILNNSSSRIVTPRIYTSSGGSSSAVSYYINNDENTGIYSGQADHLDIAAGGIDIINIDNTGIDVTGNATFTGEIDVDGSFIDLGNGGTNGRSALLSSTASSAVYLSNVNTGTAPFDQKGSVIIQPRSDASGRSVAIATGSGGSEAVAMLIDDSQNATFSGNVTTEGKLSVVNGGTASTIEELWVANGDAGFATVATFRDNASDNILLGSFATYGEDDANNQTRYGRMAIGQADVTGGTEDGYIEFQTISGGTEDVVSLTLQGTDATFAGDVSITGSLSKGSGTFKITHPLDTNKWLYHSFVEAPRADNIYRGQVELYRGIARVRIDTASNMMAGTFDALNQNVQVFVTNNDTWDLVRGYYSNGIIYIECQNELSRAVVDWLVIGERKDQTVIDWNLTDENGQLIPEWNKDND